MKVLLDSSNVVIAYSDTATVDCEGVVHICGCGYALYGQQLIEVESIPKGIQPQLWTYEKGEFLPYLSAVERIKQKGIDSYTQKLIEWGIL